MLRPIRDKVLVRIEPPEEMTEGGLWIPETTQGRTKPHLATVEAVGPKVEKVKVGDRVVIGNWSGVKIGDGTEQMLLLEDEILGVIDGGKKRSNN